MFGWSRPTIVEALGRSVRLHQMQDCKFVETNRAGQVDESAILAEHSNGS
jgi:hypothetical protein